jgi:hypothetical protein
MALTPFFLRLVRMRFLLCSGEARLRAARLDDQRR